MWISGLRGISPMVLAKKAVKDFLDDDMTTYAAALAYQIVFSLFPFIIFLIALLGFLHLPQFFDWLRDHAQMALPSQAMEQVNGVINDLQQPKGGLLSFGVIVAVWSASAGIRAIMNALNVAYDVEEGRPTWKVYVLSIVYTFGIAAMLIAATALMLVGPQGIEWIASFIGLEQIMVTLWTWLRWPIALILLCLAVAVVYYVAPDVEQSFTFITPGAIIAVLVWVIGSLAFNYYIQNFADYNATYGSIGAMIILLLYLYISSAFLLFGAEINAVIEHHSTEGKDPGEKSMK